MTCVLKRAVRRLVLVVGLSCCVAAASADTAVVRRNTNLRADPSSRQAPIRLLTAGEQVDVLSTTPQAGYYHVRTSDGREGWAWSRNLQLGTAPVTPPSHGHKPPATGGGGQPTTAPGRGEPPTSIQPGPGVPGSLTAVGCGDGLWRHVYNPQRLLIKSDCITVSGVIVDATAGREPDGVRHEADGDTHGWLKVDPEFKNLLNAGNLSDEGGNLVFEIVCHFPVTQHDAESACASFTDGMTIPPKGTHVAIRGTFVQDTNHSRWNEIHPVSSIRAQ